MARASYKLLISALQKLSPTFIIILISIPKLIIIITSKVYVQPTLKKYLLGRSKILLEMKLIVLWSFYTPRAFWVPVEIGLNIVYFVAEL